MDRSHYLEARKMLPKMPEEIFKLWLDGRIRSNGWPPSGTNWQRALRNKPINFWQKLDWNKRIIALRFEIFTEATKNIIRELIDARFFGKANSCSDIKGSSERMSKIIEYIEENNALPGHLILMKDGKFYEIVDGCHRLAAFFKLKVKINIKDNLEVWMGFIMGSQGSVLNLNRDQVPERNQKRFKIRK
ncbi:hypothetical protein ACFL2Y_01145 [Candidatus Omnitrophota bacterium]